VEAEHWIDSMSIPGRIAVLDGEWLAQYPLGRISLRSEPRAAKAQHRDAEQGENEARESIDATRSCDRGKPSRRRSEHRKFVVDRERRLVRHDIDLRRSSDITAKLQDSNTII
jgi:hypothetical protein